VRRLILLLTVMGLVAAGCGGGDDITIDGQWARNSPKNVKMGAAYMTFESAEGDVLVSGSVDPSVAEAVEIHAMMPVEGSTEEEGMAMMEMVEIPDLEILAGEPTVLQPGGFHVMFINIAKPFEIGEVIELTLNFENAGQKVIEVEVMEEDPNS
jgi:copper(I)-binding protein